MKIFTLLVNAAKSRVLLLGMLCCLAMKSEVVFSQTINAPTISPLSLCSGATVSVPLTGTGTFTSPNTFTAQLSNSTGSFAAPTSIGTLSSTTPSGTITATIPVATTTGTGYRIRIVSNNPVRTSADNGSNITINPGPGVVTVSPSSITDCYGSLNSLTATTQSQSVGASTIDVHGTFEGTQASVDTYWTRGNTSSGGTPANAAWTLRSSPYLYSVQHFFFFFFRFWNDYTFNSNNSTQFYLSNSSAQGSGTTNTTLTTTVPSNLINTNGFTSLTLNFYQNLRVRNSFDQAAVQVSTNGGGSWTTVQAFNTQQGTHTLTGFTGSFFGNNLHVLYSEGMQQASVDLSAYINVADLRIRFAYTATSGSSDFFARDNWWAIDNVTLTGSGATITPPRITWGPPDGNLYTDALYTEAYDSLGATSLPTVYAQIVPADPLNPTPQTYVAVAKIGGCESISSPVNVTVSSNYIWTGVYSSDWDDYRNWCSGRVPADGDDDVTIPAGTPYTPQITNYGLVQGINIAGGGALELSGHTLYVNGVISGQGTLTGSYTSGVEFANGSTGTVYFTPNSYPSSPTNNYLKTLKLTGNSTITLGDSLNITGSSGAFNTYGTLTVAAGSTFNTSDSLTLKSSAFGSAQVGQSGGAINGRVVVERYIPARRSWRLLAVPVNTSTQTIKAAWQEGVTNPDLVYANNLNPKPGYGTHITYDGNTANGFDPNTTSNPSIKTWNSATNGWSTSIPPTASTTITNFQAYCLFVRGSRAVGLWAGTSATADNTILRITGTLNQGTFTKSYATTSGNAVLIGNPYASPINILSVLSANTGKFTANKFWVWNPAYAGINGVGGYIAYSGGIYAPNGTGYSGGTFAQSGQAFLLEASTTGTTSVSFNESCKNTTDASVFLMPSKPKKHPAIFTNLMVPSGDSLLLADGVGAGFDKQYAAKVDKDDAGKLWNFDENIALIRDGTALSIEGRPMPLTADTLFYRLYLAQKPYVLKIFSQDLPNNLPGKVWLVDKYLNTQTAVNLDDTTLYNFTPGPDTNSYRNRFMLVINPTRIVKNPGAKTVTKGAGSVEVYANPIRTGETIRFKLNDIPKGNYIITVSNNTGKTMREEKIVHTGGSSTYNIQTGPGWTTGNYILKITGEKGYSFSTKLVIAK